MRIDELHATATRCLTAMEKYERPICDAIIRGAEPPGQAESMVAELATWRRQLRKIVAGLEKAKGE